jgi:Kae1-associated kinase Bud32
MKLITRGAEAELYKDNNFIIKKRVKKGYRIPEIDMPLRKFRTKREAKVLDKALLLGLPVPHVEYCDSDLCELKLEEIQGPKLRDYLNENNCAKLSKKIGNIIGLFHNNNIIHGDLTTSNMIFNVTEKKLYLIDFGLSFFSDKVEDRAVDIHLFRRALESKHNLIWSKSFKSFLSGYKSSSDNYEIVVKRLEQVENRGRNKTK